MIAEKIVQVFADLSKKDRENDLKMKREMKNQVERLTQDHLIIEGLCGPHDKIKYFSALVQGLYKDFQATKT